jgi:hypothetical protein
VGAEGERAFQGRLAGADVSACPGKGSVRKTASASSTTGWQRLHSGICEQHTDGSLGRVCAAVSLHLVGSVAGFVACHCLLAQQQMEPHIYNTTFVVVVGKEAVPPISQGAVVALCTRTDHIQFEP